MGQYLTIGLVTKFSIIKQRAKQQASATPLEDIKSRKTLDEWMKLAEELRDYKNKQKDFKLAILVDNLVALEMVADKNGYGKEMKDFLMRFIVEDVYKRNT